MENKNTIYVIFNGELVSEEQAKSSVLSSAFYYGTGCFETMRADSGRIFRFDRHIQRLNSGLYWLGIKNEHFINTESVKERIKILLKANGLENSAAKIRYQISLDEQNGYSVTDKQDVVDVITAEKIKPRSDHRNLSIVNTRVIPSICKPPEFKTSNMLHYRRAYQEAQKSGTDDGIMLTTDGFIAETSVSNIFWKIGDTVFTPSEECDILPGIMRNVVIDLMNGWDEFNIEQGKYLLEELMQAELVWTTNSIMEISGVKKIDHKTVSYDDRFLQELKNKFQALKEESFFT